MEDILARVPINKTTAKVTNQYGCTDEMSAREKRSCLVKALSKIEEDLLEIKNRAFSKKIALQLKKELGFRKKDIQEQLKLINKQTKIEGIESRDIGRYIVDECKSRMTEQKWKEIMIAARARKEKDLDNLKI